MVQRSECLDRTFSALGDPTRRAILARLGKGETTISGLSEPFEMSLAAVSKHVRVLEQAGLVRREIHGREHRLSLDAEPLQEATAWTLDYRHFWGDRLDTLERLLRERRRKR